MPNGQRGTARGIGIQHPAISTRPKLARAAPAPTQVRAMSQRSQPTRPQMPQPQVLQRQPWSSKQINHLAPHLQRVAQPGTAPPRGIQSNVVRPVNVSVRSAVVQRAGNSAFTPNLPVDPDTYVVTQVDSELGGMFGHSELFIEHYITAENRVDAFKIHVQTLGRTRIDIVPIVGAIDTTRPRVRGHRSYTANRQQFQIIMQTALKIRRKIEKGRIAYAEIFADRNDKWKTTKRDGGAEMSCKSFTDALLIEAGLRQGYGGTFMNAPWDL